MPEQFIKATFAEKHIGYVRQERGCSDVKLLHAWVAAQGRTMAKIVKAEFKSDNATIVKALHVREC